MIVLAMIARNEARCIERCLVSVKPWVDRMLVLDTGSTDATIDIARRAGAEVHRFDWVDDFSAARNRALELADGDWNLVLDADEWLASGGEVFAALRETAPGFVGQLRVDSEFDGGDGVENVENIAIAPSWLARVLPRGQRFVGRIHEQVRGGLERKRLPVHIGHDGYRGAQRDAKRGRNERLLQLALAEAPGDAYLHYQLGKDLEQQARFDAALPRYEEAYARGHGSDPWRHDLVLRLMHAHKRTRGWARGVALADIEMPRWPDSPDYFFALADLLLDWAATEPARGAELLPMIEAGWLKCLDLGEHPDREGAVQGRGSFLAAKNLAIFHASLGRENVAASYRKLEAELRIAVRPATR